MGVIKILPSSIVITFDIFFNKEFNNEIQKIQRQKHSPDIMINSYIPKIKFFGISFGLVESESMKMIQDYKKAIQQNVEKNLRPFFLGEFFSQIKKTNRLPCFDVYELSSDLKRNFNFSQYASKNHSWLTSYNLPYQITFESYWSKEFSFFPSYKTNNKNYDPDTIIVFKNIFKPTKGMNLQHSLKLKFLDPITANISLIEYLRLNIDYIERTREKIYSRINKRKFIAINFHNQLVDYHKFNFSTIKTERLISEYNHTDLSSDFFLNMADSESLFIHRKNQKGKEYTESLKESVKNQSSILINILQEQFAAIRKNFSIMIDLRNTYEAYNLQRLALLISLIALLISLISLIN